MKVRAKELSEKERIEVLDALYTAAGSVKGRDAMKLFLRDLLTESERIMLGRRILIARSILAQESYDDMAQRMRVGNDTIRRIGRWLEDQMPGYEQALAGLEKEMNTRAQQRQIAADPFSFAALKKKYPLHFLLFPTPKPKKNRCELP